MPSSIIAIVGLTNLIIAAEVVSTVVAMIAMSYVVSSLTTPDGLRGTTQTDPGVRAQIPPDTTTPLPVVYGDAYLGGRFVDAVIHENQFAMWYVMAISCVSDDGTFTFDKTKFYYGDRLITFDTAEPARVVSLTDGAGNVDTKINGNLFMYLYRSTSAGVITNLDNGGTSPASALPDVVMSAAVGVPPDLAWASTNRQMNGTAFCIIKLIYNRDAGTTQLQPVTFRCSQYLRGQTCAKPGDVWYDYMTNPVYGAAIDPVFVDDASRIALNNYSDQTITFNDYQGNPQTQPRYRINGVIDSGKAVLKNIDDIMQSADSWLRYEASTGLWSVTINKAETPSMALNDNNIIGSIVVGTVDLAQTVNVVEAKFPDKTNRDQYNYVTEEVPAGLLYPNEPVNKQTLTYELVNDSVQALYLANRVLEQGREDLTVTINTTYEGIQLSAGDVVSVTNSAYGWNAKLFRCMQVQESVTGDNSLGAQLQLSEYNAQVYDDFDITQFTPAGNTENPSSGYFSGLAVPVVTNAKPYNKVPTFQVNTFVPATGRTTSVTLFYTTVSSPSTTDWKTYGTQVAPNSETLLPSTVVSFVDISLPAATYYFAYKVGNDTYASQQSPMSAAFVWAPDPANANTFVATFVPATLQVPYDGSTPTFTGVTTKLYGTNGLGSVDFVASQTDSDAAFIENTWRIGNSSTTGYGGITYTNITVPTPTDGGSSADFGVPTAMPSSPASMSVPIRYKDLAGDIHQVAPSAIQYAYSIQGDPGGQTATVYLYQWSTSLPSNPTGTSTWNWTNNTNTGYTGGGGWAVTPSTNPGTPLVRLYQAAKNISAAATTTSTTVDWTTDVTVTAISQNGANGVQAASPTVYQWAISIPTGPTGTSTYTWSSNTFTPVPSGWSATTGTSPSAGYTLWAASVNLVDSATATTSSINWTTSSITARGYAGTDGTDGTNGTNGSSARICYTKTTLSSLASTPANIVTTGSNSYPPNNSWGTGTVWFPTPPSIVAGESVYQSDGVYDPATNLTTWNVPYLSALKVGSLSAITTNTGNLTVTGTIQAGTAVRSGTTMTGAGFTESNDGTFALGNSTTNLSFNGSTLTMNGSFVLNGNLATNAVSTIKIQDNAVTVPSSINASTSIAGNGAYQNVLAITITNTYTTSMPVIGFFSARVGYASVQTTQYRVDNGSGVLVDFGAEGAVNDLPSFQFYDTVAANSSKTFTIQWYGANSDVTIYQRYLTILGVKK